MKNSTIAHEADNSKMNIERLSMVVTGLDIEKVLGEAKLKSSEGEAQANATFDLIEDWGVKENIVGMSFDTTASNTGIRKGACGILEKKLGKNLLHLACRHHIYELVIGAVHADLFGPSSGPNTPLFQRFQKAWPTIKKQSFHHCNI